MLKLGWLFVKSPSKAAQKCGKNTLDAQCFWLYVVSTLAFMVLFWLKPFDFPDRTAPVPAEMQDLAYWLKAELWQPVLEFGWVFYMLALMNFMASDAQPWREGLWAIVFNGALMVAMAKGWPTTEFIGLGLILVIVRLASRFVLRIVFHGDPWQTVVRLIISLGLTACPLALLLAYARIHSFSYWTFVLGFCLSLVPFGWLVAPSSRKDWCSLINFSLGINAIGLPIAAMLGLAVLLDQMGVPTARIEMFGIGFRFGPAEIFQCGQIIGGLWLLGAFGLGVRELSGLKLGKAFAAVVCSAILQFTLAFCLHFLGAKGVLKALFYG